MHKSRKSIDKQQKSQMKTAKDRAMYILASIGKDKDSIEVIEREIIEYAKQKCKEQVARCRMAYSANRYKNPLKIKEEILKSLITELG